ncbi:MAG: hypothetical protein OXH96_23220 [Spirochaetaceae bacterium]|nr:hypothetical protein [Spirochaetaceae bacterium]
MESPEVGRRGLSRLERAPLIFSTVGEQRYKQHRSAVAAGSRIPLLVATSATPAVPSLADFDLEPIALRQSMKFHNPGFSGKSLAAVTAIGHYAAIGRRCDRSAAAVAASPVFTALAVVPLDRLAVD